MNQSVCKLIKKCKNKSNTNLVKCSVCITNWIHKECYKTFFCSEEDGGRTGDGSIDTPICGRSCLNKALKQKSSSSTEETKRVFWHNDGPTESINSLSLLIDWLTHEENYTKWKGGNKHSGSTKNTLASQILEKIKKNGIKTEHTAKDVIQKILVMEQNFRKAIDFLDGTGAGITDEESLTSAVKKICPYYYKLESVMCDRQSSRPLAMEDDLDYNFDDSDEELFDDNGRESEEKSNNESLNDSLNAEVVLDSFDSTTKTSINLSASKQSSNSSASKRSASKYFSIQGRQRKESRKEESNLALLEQLKQQ